MRIKKNIQELKPYFIDEKQVRVKLDANESPYDLPAEVKDELAGELKAIAANRYPDPSLRTLRKLVSAKEGVPEDCIIFGNGSDELIYMLYMCIERTGIISFPKPGFSMYGIGGQTFGKTLMPFLLKEPDYSVDMDSFNDVISKDPDIVFTANPNNPTGTSFPRADLITAAKKYPDIVFISDEAYGDFAGATFVPEIQDHSNLLVMKTFSKIGFAGIRLGYLMGQKDLIGEIGKVRLPYNINAYSQKIAEFYFTKNNIIKTAVTSIVQERDRTFKELAGIGIFVIPSEANFLTMRVSRSGYYEYLLDNGILVKDLKPSFGMKGFFRVTVGTPEENNAFIEATRRFAAS